MEKESKDQYHNLIVIIYSSNIIITLKLILCYMLHRGYCFDDGLVTNECLERGCNKSRILLRKPNRNSEKQEDLLFFQRQEC